VGLDHTVAVITHAPSSQHGSLIHSPSRSFTANRMITRSRDVQNPD
jgi:hypothetical protein